MDGDANDLLWAAVQRAGRIRTELQELRVRLGWRSTHLKLANTYQTRNLSRFEGCNRVHHIKPFAPPFIVQEHAFAAAATAPAAASPTAAAGSPGRKAAFAAPSSADRQPLQVVPLLLLPQGLTQAGNAGLKALAAQLPGGFTLGSGEQLAFLGAGPGSPAALAGKTGELRASPKTSRKPWSIPVSRSPQRRQQTDARQQQQSEDWAALPLQLGAAADASACGPFGEVLAALRAEGLERLPGDEQAGGHGRHAGAASDGAGVRSRAASTRGGSAGWGTTRSAAGSVARGSSGAPRLGGPRQPQRAQQQEHAAPLPTFDPAAVELQLRAKLQQAGGGPAER